ncbi:MAG: sugar ABC transporter permease [Firmicutes bacterium]|nr:sugar ABC transporter permease [Bacillota bacterium]
MVALRVALKRYGFPYALLLPALLGVGILTLYPLLNTFWLSFHRYNLLRLGQAPVFTGLENYRRIFSDEFFWFVLRNTGLFAGGCVLATMALGVGVGCLLNVPFRGRTILGVAVLLPWVIPKVAAGIVWKWIYDDQYGILNFILTKLGFDFQGFSWFSSAPIAFLAVGVVVVGQSFPFIALSILAGLQAISPEIMEAAAGDGAGPWQRFTLVTLPMLKGLLLILTILSTVWDFKVFDQIFIMTEGGPAQSTYVMGIYAWMTAFGEMQMGRAAAIAMVMFAILAVITLIYLRIARSGEGLE